VDFILTPTVGTVYRIKEIEANPIKLNADLGYYTNFMNLLDYAALAVPSGLSASGLPFGVTFFGPAGTDRDLLGLAHRFLRGHRYTMGATGIAWVPAEEVSCPAQ
jgi:allophanate hydrolase